MTANSSNIPTVVEKFYHWEKNTPDKFFLRQPYADEWRTMTYAEAGQEARKMVTVLKEHGLTKGAHIGIYSKNCYHWILADLATLIGGYVSVPLYASLPKSQLAEVIKLGDLDAIFLGKLDHWGDRALVIPESTMAIKFPHYEGNAIVDIGQDWNDLVANKTPTIENHYPQLEDLWTIKFTSGTTGTPKGVMLSHRSSSLQYHHEEKTNYVGYFNHGDIKTFSYLPLNHIGERLGVALPTIWGGGTISFAENINTFIKNLRDTQPTVFFAVPRIWNKFHQSITAKISERKLKILLGIPFVNKILKKKLLLGLGLKDVKIVATGAAITPAHIKRFFKILNLHLIEAYGMTECGPITYGVATDCPFDSVGQPSPYCEVSIEKNTDEILLKTPYMMMGYYKNPDKTGRVLVDQWMHSGDRGTIDERGNVRVVGRLSDAFKTTKGSFITPNVLEEYMSANAFIEQICVVGLGIPHPIALVNLNEDGQKSDKGIVEASILELLSQLNDTRAKYERISTVIIQKDTWSIDNNLLTPTLKVKRNNLNNRFNANFLKWHESEESIIWS
ncbi:MAG: long-chain acyl-CoA synthetase [Halioglobus sp.]|jgi:long-chain acyl-CoA synthetase